MDPRIAAALAKLESGGWSLTLDGFARRACKIKQKPTAKEYAELKRLMDGTGLPSRMVKYGGGTFPVWDYQK